MKVGTYPQVFNEILGISLPCLDIIQSPGLAKHIEKRHPNCIKYIDTITDIISSPDYIGTNPHEPQSIELVKKFDKHILIGIKLDLLQTHLYVASLYDVNESKVLRRLKSGRLRYFIHVDKSH
nr:MAG TPA: nuclease [Caudoviricetes sp.]